MNARIQHQLGVLEERCYCLRYVNDLCPKISRLGIWANRKDDTLREPVFALEAADTGPHANSLSLPPLQQ